MYIKYVKDSVDKASDRSTYSRLARYLKKIRSYLYHISWRTAERLQNIMVKRINDLLAGVPMTIVSGICLACSLLLPRLGVELPVDPYLAQNGITVGVQGKGVLERLRSEGKASVLVAENGECIDVIALFDVLRPEAGKVTDRLKYMGISTASYCRKKR